MISVDAIGIAIGLILLPLLGVSAWFALYLWGKAVAAAREISGTVRADERYDTARERSVRDLRSRVPLAASVFAATDARYLNLPFGINLLITRDVEYPADLREEATQALSEVADRELGVDPQAQAC